METVNWRKSSWSNAQGNCTEVASHDSTVLVRDTKDQGRGLVHAFTSDEWRMFISAIKDIARLKVMLSSWQATLSSMTAWP
jgi:bisphosphoglycerate-independent phosphoglycerate mutase (AlkP superfamily)